MKVLLVRPKPHKNSLGLTDLMTCEPLELEYVYTVIKNIGHEAEIADMILEKRSLKKIIMEYQPDVVMFTAYLTHVNVIKGYSDIVKEVKQNIVTAVGGVHSEVIPTDFNHPNIDYVLGINGMENVEILLNALDRGEKPIFKHDKINKDYILPKPDRQSTAKYRKKYDYAYHVPCAL